MNLFSLLFLGLLNFYFVEPLPFFSDVQQAAVSDSHIASMPYSKEEIRAVREKLNLTTHPDNPDEYLSVTELITKYGYPVEEYFVTTKDGYILRVHRIPPTRKGIAPCNRTIFLMHGLLSSSADWVILGPQEAFAYYLADLGYDVWMGNARGNSQSKNHTKLNPRHRKFWDFSWHEIGTIDVPTMIDFVLKSTNQKALYHVGHSQGTTTFYVMCSELPSYNKKIIAHYSLAPIGFMKHAFSPILRIGSKFVKELEWLSSLLGIVQILPHDAFMTFIGNKYCEGGELTEVVCRDSLFLTCGFDKAEFNNSLMPTLMGHSPAGSAAKQFFHYAQLIDSGRFRQYDYGLANTLHYGPTHALGPPSYDLKKVKAPVYLYYSRNDWLSNEKDVTKLCKELGNCRSQVLVAEHRFNHMDYLWGIHAKQMVYTVVTDDIVNNLAKDQYRGRLDDTDTENEFDSDSENE
ncbi:hypothetical protein HHI36_011023 [Cryptolaemus montrouzieri]|uniref:Partial AB-hydrolase lipase domain-containing protein n=1 Tax=Cryptolaemus montrouzieri TaxID=559131 RepID=A0ABD2MKI3_9CUCU